MSRAASGSTVISSARSSLRCARGASPRPWGSRSMETPAEYDWDAHWRAGGSDMPRRAQPEAASPVLGHLPDGVEAVADLGSGGGGAACPVARALPPASRAGDD